jgi:molecular chaperone DnaK
MIHMTEKSLNELGDKVDESTKSNVQSAIAELKTVLETDNLEEIKAKTEALTQASHKLAELMYQQASQQGGGAAGAGATGGAAGADTSGAGASKKDDDDVVDADFEEVK